MIALSLALFISRIRSPLLYSRSCVVEPQKTIVTSVLNITPRGSKQVGAFATPISLSNFRARLPSLTLVRPKIKCNITNMSQSRMMRDTTNTSEACCGSFERCVHRQEAGFIERKGFS